MQKQLFPHLTCLFKDFDLAKREILINNIKSFYFTFMHDFSMTL